MTDELHARFRKAYWAVVRSQDLVRLHVWEEQGLTLPQLRVLFLVRTNPGITTNVMASRLGITVSTVSGLVDKLARAGLVERGQDPDDRRVVPLCLTERGQAAIGEVRQVNKAYLQTLVESLDADLESVTSALERLAEAAERMQAANNDILRIGTTP